MAREIRCRYGFIKPGNEIVGVSAENTDNNKDTAPILAKVTVKGCIGHKFVPTIQDEDCALDLFAAIYHGELESLSDVFEYDANVDVNQVDSLGRTPADFAAIMGQPEMTQLLIEKGGKHKVTNRPTMRALARKRARTREEIETTVSSCHH